MELYPPAYQLPFDSQHPAFQPPVFQAPDDQPIDDEPLYVNAKQYFRILKRRVARARLEELHRLSRQRKVRILDCPFHSSYPHSFLPSHTFTNLVINMPCAVLEGREVASSPQTKSPRRSSLLRTIPLLTTITIWKMTKVFPPPFPPTIPTTSSPQVTPILSRSSITSNLMSFPCPNPIHAPVPPRCLLHIICILIILPVTLLLPLTRPSKCITSHILMHTPGITIQAPIIHSHR